MLGCHKGNREKYDLIDIIFIGLGNFEDKNDETIVGFLDNILDRDLEPLKRKQILKDKFDITTSDDLMEVFGSIDGVRTARKRKPPKTLQPCVFRAVWKTKNSGQKCV